MLLAQPRVEIQPQPLRLFPVDVALLYHLEDKLLRDPCRVARHRSVTGEFGEGNPFREDDAVLGSGKARAALHRSLRVDERHGVPLQGRPLPGLPGGRIQLDKPDEATGIVQALGLLDVAPVPRDPLPGNPPRAHNV